MKEIYLVRHGQTEYNRLGIVQGSGVDASLNETGRKQAEAFHSVYGSLHFDKVYVSQLRRTHETLSPFMRRHPYEQHAGLNEISWGIYEGKKSSPEDKQAFRELLGKWRNNDYHASFERGESIEDVAARQRKFIPALRNRPSEERVLICSHGRAMRIFLCQLLEVPFSEMDQFGHVNLGLYHLELNDLGRFSLLKANDQAHLEGL